MLKLKKFREIRSLKEIPSPEYTLSCTHCPLYTAMRSTTGIEGSMTVIVGTPECTYYVRNIGGGRSDGSTKLVSVVLDWYDVTFGSSEKFNAAFAELVDEYHPKAVFIITTCVPEITNDDLDAFAEACTAQYGVPIGVVHTEHFRVETEASGHDCAIEACADLMRPVEKGNTVNILGQGQSSFSETELCAALEDAKVEIGCFIPECSVDDLMRAPAAKLNIVVSESGLLLAKKMEKRFGIPYLYFEAHAYPDREWALYEQLFQQLGQPVPERIKAAYQAARVAVEQIGDALKGTTYFIEEPAFPVGELNAFLIDHGMSPLVIHLRTMPPLNDPDLKKVLELSDPYALHYHNSQDVDELRNALHPDLLIGLGERQSHDSKPLGFAAIEELVSSLLNRKNRGSSYEDGRRSHDGGDRGHREGRDEGRHSRQHGEETRDRQNSHRERRRF